MGFYPAFDDTDMRLGSIPIILIDLHRNSYEPDFERDLPAYVKAIFENLNWLAIDQRLNQLGLGQSKPF